MLYRETEATIQAATCSQEIGTGGILKINTKQKGNCWSDFYKYVKRRKGNKENILAIKDCNGRIITDAIRKANTFNSLFDRFSSEGIIPHIQDEKTDDPFTTDIKTIRRRIKTIRKNKSVGPDRISGEFLKLGGEAMPALHDY